MAEAPPISPSLPDLILSMEQSILAAKQLSATTDPTHLIQIYSSLHQTNNHLSTFLSSAQLPQPLSTLPAENSLSSATTAAADVNGNEPMQVSDDVDDVEQEYSRGTVDSVEEKMRDCFIKNKRLKKRPFSPSVAALAEERRLNDDWFNGIRFDPYATRLRALDLVYQFHG